MSDNFTDSFLKGFQVSHTIANDARVAQAQQQQQIIQMMQMKRAQEAAQIQNALHQFQMMKLAKELTQAPTKEVNGTIAEQQPDGAWKPVYTAPDKSPTTLENILAENVKTGKMTLPEAIAAKRQQEQQPLRTLENILADKVNKGEMTLQDAIAEKRRQEGKPLNVENNIDAILAGMPEFKGYFSDPAVQKRALDWYAEPGNAEKIRAQAAQYSRDKTPTQMTPVQTTEGIQGFTTKGPGVGTIIPSATPSGEPASKPMPEGATAKMSDLAALKGTLGKIKELYKPDYVGPVAGRAYGVAENFVNLPADQVKFYSYVRDAKDALLRARSGAQINEQEYARLVKFLPDENLPSKNFEARRERFEEQVDIILGEKAKVYGTQGYRPPGNGGPVGDSPKQQSTGKYRIIQVK